jgi:hypothetical protein
VEREAPRHVLRAVEELVHSHVDALVEEQVERFMEENAFSKADLELVASQKGNEYPGAPMPSLRASEVGAGRRSPRSRASAFMQAGVTVGQSATGR